MSTANGGYYLPEPSHWPIVGSIGMFTTLGGFAFFLNGGTPWVMAVGAVILLVMLFGWFGTVISESERGLYNDQVDRSFRMGMLWFIFSEIFFFLAFFGALFGDGGVDAPETGDEFEVFPGGELVVEQRLVREPGDELFGGEGIGAGVDAEDGDCAVVSGKEARDHAQGGGLAGAVGTEKRIDLAAAHIEGDVVDGGSGPVDNDTLDLRGSTAPRSRALSGSLPGLKSRVAMVAKR